MADLRYAELAPPPALRPDVECAWIVWSADRSTRREPEHIVPDACPELIVHLEDPFARRIGARWVRQPRAFLAGTLSRPWSLRAGARVETIGLRFRPGALPALFPIDMAAATDREVPLERVVGAAFARALARALAAARTRPARLRAALACLATHPAPPARASLAVSRPAVRLLLAGRGHRRIADVARALGVSPRRLERAFARDLGIRPKLFARIVRLNAALARLGAPDRARAADIALEAGYFDEAHLARDFRTVAGRTTRTAPGPLGRRFVDPVRLLTLLAGE
jgi:AraC-like DNA-binding protein